MNVYESYLQHPQLQNISIVLCKRIFDTIVSGGHAVNIESIWKHHPELWDGFSDPNLAERTIHIITESLQSCITTWKVYENKTLVLPLVPGEPYDFSVKWGDGSGEEKIHLLRGWNADENKNSGTHIYPEPGYHTVTIRGVLRGFHRPSETKYNRAKSLCSSLSLSHGILIHVSQWGLVQLTSCENMFSDPYESGPNVPLPIPRNAPDLRWCTNMHGMFKNCKSNFSLHNLSKWDVSSVMDMSYTFENCSLFNKAIGTWNVRNVTNMQHMFSGCTSFNKPISNWAVCNVTHMNHMFRRCEVFDQPLLWDVSKVTDMRNMFQYCYVFNQPIGVWDVSNVTNMTFMFYHCRKFNKPIGGWEVHNVQPVQMYGMFDDCQSFDQYIGGWGRIQIHHGN
jgi:surface protein